MKIPSLLAFLILALSVYDLARRRLDDRTAFFSVALLTVFPLSITTSVSPAPDLTAVALSVLAMAALDRYLDSGRWATLLFSAAALSAASLVKAPMLLITLPCGVLVFQRKGWTKFRDRRMVIVFVLALLPLIAWMIHSHSLNANSQLTTSNTAGDLVANYMRQRGRIGFYTDPRWYAELWSKMSDGYSGPGLAVAFLGLLVALATRSPFRAILLSWVAALIFYVGFFPFHLVTHRYYSIPVAPLLGISGGIFLSWVTTRESRKASAAGWAVAVGSLGCIAITVPNSMKLNATYNYCQVAFGETARGLTAEDDLLIVAAPGLQVWDGTLLYRSDRRGWGMRLPTDKVPSSAKWEEPTLESTHSVEDDRKLIDYLEDSRARGATMIGLFGRPHRHMKTAPRFVKYLNRKYTKIVSRECYTFYDLSSRKGRQRRVKR